MLTISSVLVTQHRLPVPESSPNYSTCPTISLDHALATIRHLDDTMRKITVLSLDQSVASSDDPGQPTLIMSILNVTPDSFSDGGKLSPTDVDNIVATAKSHIASGAAILDVGGQSTRPNATMLPAEEELRRVLPALRAIRTIPEVASGSVAISLDTFYADVARPCIREGLVDIVNDVSAGQLDPKMLATVAELGKTIVLMHMRGTPQTMTTMTDYSPRGVVYTVAGELVNRLHQALKAGIPPWRIILDPGVGFAKNEQQNLALLRAGIEGFYRYYPALLPSFPWLIGTSRKGFIGKITGTANAGERVWGTAACVTAAVAGGARIVRVHDVEEMSKVAKMADALYRTKTDETEDGKREMAEKVVDEENEMVTSKAAGQLDRPSEDKSSADLKRRLQRQKRRMRRVKARYARLKKHLDARSDESEEETSHDDSEASSMDLPVQAHDQGAGGGSKAPRSGTPQPSPSRRKNGEHASPQLEDEGTEAQTLVQPEQATTLPRLEDGTTPSQAINNQDKKIGDGEGGTTHDQQACPKENDSSQVSDLAPLPQR